MIRVCNVNFRIFESSNLRIPPNLFEIRLDVLLGYGVGEEGTILVLGLEAGLEGSAFRRIGECGLGGLRSSFQCVLALYVLGVGCLGGVEQVDTELLFAAGAALEIERLGAVELTHDAGKHTVEFDFSHRVRHSRTPTKSQIC